MAYVVNGVEVEISQQAVRPREPPRPSRATTTASPEMLTRQLRPRETTNVNLPVADQYLTQISALKGQQKQLEALLKQMGIALKACQARIASASKANDRNGQLRAKVECSSIEHDIMLCINAIKDCASKVATAADSAVAKGASVVEVKQVAMSSRSVTPVRQAPKSGTYTQTPTAVAPVTRTSTPIRQDPRSGTYVAPTQTSDPATAPPPATTSAPVVVTSPASTPEVKSPSTTVVETNTPVLTKTGVIVPGPDATVVEVPTQAEPGASAPPPKSGSGFFGIAVLIAGLGVVWAFSKK